MKEYLEREGGRMSKKTTFTPEEMNEMRNLWMESESLKLDQSRSIENLEREQERALQRERKLSSEMEQAQENSKRIKLRLEELSQILRSTSSEGWATFALDRRKEEELTLKLSSINEIISKKGIVDAVNGLQIDTDLTHGELVKCIESQNDKDRQADLDAVKQLEE